MRESSTPSAPETRHRGISRLTTSKRGVRLAMVAAGASFAAASLVGCTSDTQDPANRPAASASRLDTAPSPAPSAAPEVSPSAIPSPEAAPSYTDSLARVAAAYPEALTTKAVDKGMRLKDTNDQDGVRTLQATGDSDTDSALNNLRITVKTSANPAGGGETVTSAHLQYFIGPVLDAEGNKVPGNQQLADVRLKLGDAGQLEEVSLWGGAIIPEEPYIVKVADGIGPTDEQKLAMASALVDAPMKALE